MKLAFGFFGLALLAGCNHLGASHTTSVGSDGVEVTIDGGEVIKGSGKQAPNSLKLASFSKVRIDFPAIVTMQKGAPSATVTADDNLLPFLECKVEGNELVFHGTKNMHMEKMPTLRLTGEGIEAIYASGACQLTANSGLARRLDVNLNGATRFTLKGEFDQLGARLTGASKLSASGAATDLQLEVDGSSRVEAADLRSKTAKVEANGASNVEITVSEALTAEASGASSVSYAGSPKVTEDTSGASRITKR